MDEELRQHFHFVEQSFFADLPSFLKSFSSSTEIIDLAKLRDQTPMLLKFRPHKPSFELRVTLISNQFYKGLEFSYSEGPHVSGNRYHSITLKIYRTDEENKSISGKNRFWMDDYFAYKNMDEPIPVLFFEDDNALAQPKICESINQIVWFLNFDEIKRILTSQDWFVVPSRISKSIIMTGGGLTFQL